MRVQVGKARRLSSSFAHRSTHSRQSCRRGADDMQRRGRAARSRPQLHGTPTRRGIRRGVPSQQVFSISKCCTPRQKRRARWGKAGNDATIHLY